VHIGQGTLFQSVVELVHKTFQAVVQSQQKKIGNCYECEKPVLLSAASNCRGHEVGTGSFIDLLSYRIDASDHASAEDFNTQVSRFGMES